MKCYDQIGWLHYILLCTIWPWLLDLVTESLWLESSVGAGYPWYPWFACLFVVLFAVWAAMYKLQVQFKLISACITCFQQLSLIYLHTHWNTLLSRPMNLSYEHGMSGWARHCHWCMLLTRFNISCTVWVCIIFALRSRVGHGIMAGSGMFWRTGHCHFRLANRISIKYSTIVSV